MNKEFIPYEQALELKELGFDEICMAGYDGDDNSLYIGYISNDGIQYNPQYYTKAPLYQQVFRWFRENYGLHHHIEYMNIADRYEGWASGTMFDCKTYEEAELSCLKKLIKIIKGK
jgi:hypothetical protein